MKNILFILFFGCLSITAFAQDKTISKTMPSGDTYYYFNGADADTLTGNQDTLDIVITYRGDGYVKKIATKTRWDLLGTADTTYTESIFGKEFADDETYVQIVAATLQSAVATDNTVSILTSDYTETIAAATDIISQITAANTDTVTVAARTITPLDKSYRNYRIRYIYNGPDYTGSGIKLDQFEIKFYTE